MHPSTSRGRGRLHLEPGLLEQLAAQRLERMLALLDEASGQVPGALERRPRPPDEKHPTRVVGDDGTGCRGRVRVGDEAALLTRRTAAVRFDCGSAARA